MVQNSKGTKEYGKSPSHPILRPQVISPQRQRVFCFLFILPEMIMDSDPGAAGHLPQGILSQAGVGAMVLWQGILDVELSHASLAGGVSVLDGLSIQQPSDLGHWSSPYGALQHKILALNDGAVLQDTGEGGGHLHHSKPFHLEGPATGHLASGVGSSAAVCPTVPGPGSQQAEVMGASIFINLNAAFLSPHGVPSRNQATPGFGIPETSHLNLTV